MGCRRCPSTVMPPNFLDFFPQANGDGLNIIWDHAVNSRSQLSSSLRGPAMILEADISMSGNSRFPVPIMAHPPCITSDITMEQWLNEIVLHNSNKGVKLDFKSTEVVEPACRILAKVIDKLHGPVVLNADILPGPDCSTVPVDAWTFLTLCRTRFPRSIISVGWTTDDSYDTCFKMGYSRDMIDRMVTLVKEYNLMQPVTFPVCAPLLKYSIQDMQRLLMQVTNSSLTVFGSKIHMMTVEDLIVIRNSFGISQVFYDLPPEILEVFLSVT